MVCDEIDVELDHEAVEFLVEYGYLHETAASITKLYLKEGEKALVGRRRWVFETYVVKPYFTAACRRCDCPIPGCERIGAWENGGNCSWCNHQLEKLEADKD